MSGILASRSALPWQHQAAARRGRTTVGAQAWQLPAARRALQLSLASLWLLDGVLQFQPYMFSKAFAAQVIAPGGQGNPAVIAGPITWAAHLVSHHPVGTNAAFATTQVLLGLGIAWRPTVKPALAASVVWALSVWWLGEGLGGILTAGAGPIPGGPGAALLYALLAVLLWPPAMAATASAASPPVRSRFVAAGLLGETPARLLWFVLWVALAGFALQGTNRSAQGLHDAIADSAGGQPAWLAAIDNYAAAVVAHRGLAVSVGLAILLAAIALAIFASPVVARSGVVVAAGLAVAIWVAAQALGGIFGGQGTDPNTGPLLVVIALAYWPIAAPAVPDVDISRPC